LAIAAGAGDDAEGVGDEAGVVGLEGFLQEASDGLVAVEIARRIEGEGFEGHRDQSNARRRSCERQKRLDPPSR
jgi:hypothetical protein